MKKVMTGEFFTFPGSINVYKAITESNGGDIFAKKVTGRSFITRFSADRMEGAIMVEISDAGTITKEEEL